MHPLTLRFAPELERAYAEDAFPRILPQIRVAFLVGGLLLLVGALMITNLVRADARLFTISAILALVNLLVVAATFTGAFRLLMGPILALPFVGFAIASAAVILLLPRLPIIISVLMAQVIVLIYAFVFSRMGFLHANLVAWVMLACSLSAAIAAGGGLRSDMPLYAMHVFNAYLSLALTGYFVERYIRRDFLHRRALDAERARSDHLLLNILPRTIAERLKEREATIADAHPEVSVLFADLVDFTGLSATLTPREVVESLNSIFSAFDELADKHGLEKIKTLGDGYLAVAGVPVARPDHCEAAAAMALEMRSVIRQLAAAHGWPVRVRIGIHSGGPAIAGVVGRRKFAYDVWGDVVNTASRMESHGLPDRIQVSEATFERLRDSFLFQDRGIIQIKGKPPMRTYLLVGRSSDPPPQETPAPALGIPAKSVSREQP